MIFIELYMQHLQNTHCVQMDLNQLKDIGRLEDPFQQF